MLYPLLAILVEFQIFVDNLNFSKSAAGARVIKKPRVRSSKDSVVIRGGVVRGGGRRVVYNPSNSHAGLKEEKTWTWSVRSSVYSKNFCNYYRIVSDVIRNERYRSRETVPGGLRGMVRYPVPLKIPR